MHKLGEFIHDKGNIRLSHLEMLGAIDHFTVYGGIDRHNTSLVVKEVPTTSGVETGLEPSILCLLRSSMTYFC